MWYMARKTTQCIVFLLLVAAPAFALYDVVQHSRSVYGESLAARRIAGMGTVSEFMVGAQEKIWGQRSRNARPLSDSLAGSPWALRIGGYVMIEPLNALGALVAGGGFAGNLLLAALPLLVLTILLGRVFCGWLCPIHFLLEMADSLRALLARLGVPVRNLRLRRKMKFAALGLGAFSTAVIGAQIFPLFYPPAVLGRQVFELVFFGGLGGGAVFLLSLAIVEIFLSRRVWCRYLCPGGALYALLGSFRVVSIDRRPSLCDSCGDCNQMCAFGLSPMTDQTGMECTSCLECVRSCPTNALSIRLNPPIRFGRQRKRSHLEGREAA